MSAIISNLVLVLRILKMASCPTSFGKAILTYYICCTTDNDMQFRVVANTGVLLVQFIKVIYKNHATYF